MNDGNKARRVEVRLRVIDRDETGWAKWTDRTFTLLSTGMIADIADGLIPAGVELKHKIPPMLDENGSY
jgi:hypothetical protein